MKKESLTGTLFVGGLIMGILIGMTIGILIGSMSKKDCPSCICGDVSMKEIVECPPDPICEWNCPEEKDCRDKFKDYKGYVEDMEEIAND